jgi:GNAT superfamily N-acetyltransferase
MPAPRRATAADADAVADVFLAARAAMTYLPELHTDDETRAFFGTVVSDAEVWVVDADGGVAGFAALGRDELEHLYVQPRLQGRGLGTALLDVAKERRPSGLELWVFQPNEGARRFYERHGFELVRLTDGSGNEERVPDARYAWRPAR